MSMVAGLCYLRISGSICAGAEYHTLSLSDFGILKRTSKSVTTSTLSF